MAEINRAESNIMSVRDTDYEFRIQGSCEILKTRKLNG
jgi:hypothetical protein